MKSRMKRFMAVLLTMLMTVNSLQLTVLAEGVDSTKENNESEMISDEKSLEESDNVVYDEASYINPLYEDVIDASDLLSADESDISTLSDEEYCTTVEDASAIMRQQMVERNENITIYYETTEDSYSQYMQEIGEAAIAHTGVPTEGDYLKFQYAGWNCKLSGTVSDDTYYLKLNYTVTYYTTAEQETAVDQKVNEVLTQLDLSGKSEYEKIKGVYDYICSNVTYDYDNLEDDNYKLKYTAYAALVDKTAVCQGYAVLLYRFLEELGVDGRIISGTGNGGRHAWNIAEIGESYYNLDSTWDAGSTTYDYFLRSDANFGDHTRGENYSEEAFTSSYPMGEEDYTYAGDEIVDSGTCGEFVTWTLDNEGVLTISGSWVMKNYSSDSDEQPWSSKRDSITTVIIEDGVSSIGNYAFEKCSNLKNIVLPASIEDIGEGAFYNCSSLESIELPANVTRIEDETFFACTSLKKIEIPNEVTYIGFEAFSLCSSLEKIDFPNELTYLGDEAFYSCSTLKSIEIPEGVTEIRNGVFSCCSSIEQIILPNSLTTIGESAFGACESLKSIEIPDSVIDIGWHVFYNCKNLESVTLPKNITSLGWFVFSECSSLKSIEIPEGVIEIGEEAFANCSNLKDIIFKGAAPEFWQRCFENVVATVYYPANDLSWTEEVRQNYGGTLTWVAKESGEKKLVITSQPKDFTGNIGDTATFTVGAEGDGVTYQWQYCNSGSSAWKNSTMTGSDTDTIEVKITKGRIGQKYRCIVKDSRENKLTSEAAQIVQAEKLTIIEQPESFTGNIGDTAIFGIKAKGEGVTYQWQYCSNGSTAWKNSTAAGADTDTLEVKVTKGRIGQKYRCIVKDSKGNKLTSETAEILKSEKEFAITKQPENASGNIGDTAVFTIGAEGEGVTYQWQYCNNGSTAWTNSKMTGSDTDTIEVKITKGRIGQKYRCIVKDSKGKKLTSEAAEIIKAEKELAIVRQPEDVVGKVGDTAVFKIEAEGEGITYQWQYCSNGSDNWTNSKMTGSDTNTIEVKITKGRIGQKYRCIVKDSKGKKLTSEAAQIIQAEK